MEAEFLDFVPGPMVRAVNYKGYRWSRDDQRGFFWKL